MAVNPYAQFADYQPTQNNLPDPFATCSPAGRKTNWFLITSALIGLAIGFATAPYPAATIANDVAYGEAIGRVFGHAIVFMILGAICGCVLRWVIARPLRALLIVFGLAGLGGLVLPSVAARLPPRAVPLPAALVRHQELERLQAENEPFSLVLPGNWDQLPDEGHHFHYRESLDDGTGIRIGLDSDAHAGRITDRWVETQARNSLPDDMSLRAVSHLKIDGKKVYAIDGRVQGPGKTVWVAIYLFPGRDKLYQLMACGPEPKSPHAQATLRDILKSVRFD